MSSWFQRCNSEAKGALRTYHTDTGSVSLTLMVFFMSCFTLAVLLHYLHYEVRLSHKQTYLKICIVKAQELLEDIIHTATLWCIGKLLVIAGNILNFAAISLFSHLFLHNHFPVTETLIILNMPAEDILQNRIIKFSSKTRSSGDTSTYVEGKVLQHIWIQIQQTAPEEDVNAQRIFPSTSWCWTCLN